MLGKPKVGEIMKHAYTTFATFIFVVTLAFLCSAQTVEVDADKIMDAAFDLETAAKRADKLTADGMKYCNWSKPRMDASDLDDAISRHLLKHGPRVPDHIPASQMWSVSFVAVDLMRLLDLGGTGCALHARYSSEAHSLFGEYQSAAGRFRDLTFKFKYLAAQQTLWQEGTNMGSLRRRQQGDLETYRVRLRSILAVAHEVNEAADAAEKVTRESERVSGCMPADPVVDSKALVALIDGIEHEPNDYLLLASNMSAANLDGDMAEMDVMTAAQGCSIYAGEKKKARNMAEQTLAAHRRLVKAVVDFEPLVFQQTEWEESILEEQSIGEEH